MPLRSRACACFAKPGIPRVWLSGRGYAPPVAQLRLKCDEMALKLEEANKKLEELAPAE